MSAEYDGSYNKMKASNLANIGERWKSQVPSDETNLAALKEGLLQRNAAASAWVQQTHEHDLEHGIASCINRGSDRLALPIPTDIITARAISDFTASLADQGLLIDIVIQTEKNSEALMIVTPAR